MGRPQRDLGDGLGLNIAFEVEERRYAQARCDSRRSCRDACTDRFIALSLVFFGRSLHGNLHAAAIALRAVEWLTLLAALLFYFAMLYRFAPNLENASWQWSTPGALCALLLWVAATAGAHIYLGYFNDYSRSYGHLNSAVMLLLWLCLSNAAVLIGGEMNSGSKGSRRTRRSCR